MPEGVFQKEVFLQKIFRSYSHRETRFRWVGIEAILNIRTAVSGLSKFDECLPWRACLLLHHALHCTAWRFIAGRVPCAIDAPVMALVTNPQPHTSPMPLILQPLNFAIICEGNELEAYDVKQDGPNSIRAYVASEAGKVSVS
jgi:hypothetical protein